MVCSVCRPRRMWARESTQPPGSSARNGVFIARAQPPGSDSSSSHPRCRRVPALVELPRRAAPLACCRRGTGVVASPPSSQAMEHEGDLDRWLRSAQVRFLRLGWVDSAGVLRTQAVSSARAAAMSAEGLGVVSGVQALPVFADIVQPGLGIGAIGQVWLRPAIGTLRVLPWEPPHAATLGAFVTRDGSPWPFCPRTALLRAVARLEHAGLSLQAGFEHEFLLLRRRDGTLEHFENSHYASAHGLNRAGPVLDAIAEALESQGVPVRAMLKEAGLSQFELSTEHGAPLLAADRFVVVRETIGAVAAQHDLVGTCLPLVFADEAGSGWHIHFSLWRGGRNLTGAGSGDGLGLDARAFVG